MNYIGTFEDVSKKPGERQDLKAPDQRTRRYRTGKKEECLPPFMPVDLKSAIIYESGTCDQRQVFTTV
jgi:hypothetical protein